MKALRGTNGIRNGLNTSPVLLADLLDFSATTMVGTCIAKPFLSARACLMNKISQISDDQAHSEKDFLRSRLGSAFPLRY